MGISLLFDLNTFNIFGNFSALANPKQEGLLGGFLPGLSLGIIWLPCVSPVLGSILTMVAVSGKAGYGALMLFISIPLVFLFQCFLLHILQAFPHQSF
ncbi:MAG: cytochrome c biogenesis protein CcdA [Methanosarcina flavescens]|jgi:cytochrome c-type biogenesis protein|uniref:cytochrome c biogenesis protein CcdA n=1 Tax=Methanosarcina flavescens TaxID=1715806 RepID=UPI001D054D5E|nr:cytochrome c biogenesis protein CcdA [Methanosarcina flavescens]